MVGPAADGRPASSDAPQRSQNCASERTGWPFGHSWSTAKPHDEQKFASALFSAPQFEHVLTAEAYSRLTPCRLMRLRYRHSVRDLDAATSRDLTFRGSLGDFQVRRLTASAMLSSASTTSVSGARVSISAVAPARSNASTFAKS